MIDHPGLDRAAAFAALGERVEALGGRFRTAGDFGTTEEDLRRMAARTRFVHTGSDALAAAVARGLLACARACAERLGGRDLAGLAVVVQGAGAIGAAVARALAAAGARVAMSDLVPARAHALAEAIDARVVPAEAALEADAELLVPCAIGGVIDAAVANRLRARAVCGAADNVLADADADRVLARRGILHVPDVIASAGAVVDGVGRTVMGLADRGPLIDALGETARAVLAEAAASGRTTTEVALARARRRLEAAGAPTPPAR